MTNKEMKKIATFKKNTDILIAAFNSGRVNPCRFTASEVGLSGAACRSLKDNWDILTVVDHVTSFIPIDEDEGVYRKVETNVYKTYETRDTLAAIIRNAYRMVISDYDLKITSLLMQVKMLQNEKAEIIEKYMI